MAFVRPTLAELVDRIQADFVSRLSLVGGVLRRSMVYVLARVLAGASHMLHAHLDFIARQIHPATATGIYLLRWGRFFGINPLAATFAGGSVTITGTNGIAIPINTVLVRSDGATYKTTAEVTIASGTATAGVLAQAAGIAGNADAGVVLAFESPILNVNANTTVAAPGLSGGNDAETEEAHRVRILERAGTPPDGGSDADYIAWAKLVAGVTRVWPVRNGMGLGTVLVRFVRDNDTPSIIPDSAEVAAVQARLDAEKPVTATVYVVAPIAAPINFTLHVVPDTTATRAAVTAELADLIKRDAIPGGTILLSQIETAIGIASGVTDYVLTTPAANVPNAAGNLATMGTITWV